MPQVQHGMRDVVSPPVLDMVTICGDGRCIGVTIVADLCRKKPRGDDCEDFLKDSSVKGIYLLHTCAHDTSQATSNEANAKAKSSQIEPTSQRIHPMKTAATLLLVALHVHSSALAFAPLPSIPALSTLNMSKVPMTQDPASRNKQFYDIPKIETGVYDLRSKYPGTGDGTGVKIAIMDTGK